MPFFEYLPTPIGFLKIEADNAALKAIAFVDDAGDNKPSTLTNKACQQLKEYFSHHRKSFELPLAFSGSAFQQEVWALVAKIPFGKTMSYFYLAKVFGDTKAIRAVAGANAKNPFAIIIPCHRVLGSNGSLTGYAWGLDKKEWLLQHEGAIPQRLF